MPGSLEASGYVANIIHRDVARVVRRSIPWNKVSVIDPCYRLRCAMSRKIHDNSRRCGAICLDPLCQIPEGAQYRRSGCFRPEEQGHVEALLLEKPLHGLGIRLRSV